MKTLPLLFSLLPLAAFCYGAELPGLPADAKFATDVPYADSAHARQKLDVGGNIDQSRLFQAALEKAGVPNEFITLPGIGHSHVDIWTKERECILGFFAKHLKPSATQNEAP